MVPRGGIEPPTLRFSVAGPQRIGSRLVRLDFRAGGVRGVLYFGPPSDYLPRNDWLSSLRGAQEALARNEAVNRSRPSETPLGLDITLHCGDVFYGNIGAANRLDFTVIGPAVNEVSRMEALCG